MGRLNNIMSSKILVIEYVFSIQNLRKDTEIILFIIFSTSPLKTIRNEPVNKVYLEKEEFYGVMIKIILLIL